MPPEYSSIELIVYAFLSVLIIGLFPISFMVLIYQNILLKRNLKNVELVNTNLKEPLSGNNTITLYSKNNKNMLSLN